MKKKANVIMLPTIGNSIPAIKYAPNLKYQVCNSDYTANQLQTAGFDVYDLYIVTDDEIKEGDWVIETSNNNLVAQFDEQSLNQRSMGCKKIIATTDPELKYVQGTTPDSAKEWKQIFDLPQPSKNFIEEYCKVGGIDEVDVEYEEVYMSGKEELKVEPDLTNWSHTSYKLKSNSNNEIIIHPIKDSWTKEEVVSLFREYQNAKAKQILDKESPLVPLEWIKENL